MKESLTDHLMGHHSKVVHLLHRECRQLDLHCRGHLVFKGHRKEIPDIKELKANKALPDSRDLLVRCHCKGHQTVNKGHLVRCPCKGHRTVNGILQTRWHSHHSINHQTANLDGHQVHLPLVTFQWEDPHIDPLSMDLHLASYQCQGRQSCNRLNNRFHLVSVHLWVPQPPNQ
jgi:hypothetical protein